MLMSTEASGQPMVDDEIICNNSALATLQQVAKLINKVENFLASNQQQSASCPTSADVSKYVLVSALKCEYRCHSCDQFQPVFAVGRFRKHLLVPFTQRCDELLC